MTVLPFPGMTGDGSTARDRRDVSICVDGVEMRAQCRDLTTVITVNGDVDASTSARVQAFAARFIRAGNALVLDLSGVVFFSACGISVLDAIDAACRSAGVPCAVVSSPLVNRVLRLTACDTTMPTASSVPAALRELTALTEARRRFALAITAPDQVADHGDVADRSTTNAPLASAAATVPPPAFTLGSALRWLGHDCSGRPCCRAPIDAMDASIWFVRREPGFVTIPHEKHVLVDPGTGGEAQTSILRLIYQVNRCTHGEAIVVRPRTRADQRQTHVSPVAAPSSRSATRLRDVAGPSEGDLRTISEASRW